MLHRCLLKVSTPSDQQAQDRNGQHHSSHPWQHGETTADSAEWQGDRNGHGACPVSPQVQGHSLLHQRDQRHQVHRGGMLPADFTEHDPLPHNGPQDSPFHACPAGPAVHLKCHHSAISMLLRALNWANPEPVWKRLCTLWFPWPVPGLRGQRLLLGDWVMMSKTCRQFVKGYTGNWSKEIFCVEAVHPRIYVVAYATADPIKRSSFYGSELQKVLLDYFDIETIVDTQCHGGKWQYLVKLYLAGFNY